MSSQEIKLFVIRPNICAKFAQFNIELFVTNSFPQSLRLPYWLQHLMSMNGKIDFSAFSSARRSSAEGEAICKLSSTADKANVPNDTNQQKVFILFSHTHTHTVWRTPAHNLSDDVRKISHPRRRLPTKSRGGKKAFILISEGNCRKMKIRCVTTWSERSSRQFAVWKRCHYMCDVSMWQQHHPLQ